MIVRENYLNIFIDVIFNSVNGIESLIHANCISEL